MQKNAQSALVSEMLTASRLSGIAVDRLLEQALDAGYWRRLCPALSIDAAERLEIGGSRSLSDDELQRIADSFEADGYFHADAVLPGPRIERMRDCVERLRAAHWPPVFAFIFDEFWTATRTATVDGVLSRTIGAGWRQNSVVWVYYVAPSDGASGWKPHTDGNGMHRLTIWIPLTDAAVDNGCMYVIPRTQVPASLSSDYEDWKTVDRSDLTRLLHGTRALPARAGSLLGWGHDIVHWGSIAKGAVAPRISIAVEFLGAQATPTPWEHPILGGPAIPSFSQRLYAIGKRLLEYRTFEPVMIRYAELAARLMGACASGNRP